MKNIKKFVAVCIMMTISIAAFIGCSKEGQSSKADRSAEAETAKSVVAADDAAKTETAPAVTSLDGDIEGVAWDEPKERPDIASALMDKVNTYREKNGIRQYEDPYVYDDETGDYLVSKGSKVCKDIVVDWKDFPGSGHLSTGIMLSLDDDGSASEIADSMFEIWTSSPANKASLLAVQPDRSAVDVAVMHVYEYWDGKWRRYQAVLTTAQVQQ